MRPEHLDALLLKVEDVEEGIDGARTWLTKKATRAERKEMLAYWIDATVDAALALRIELRSILKKGV